MNPARSGYDRVMTHDTRNGPAAEGAIAPLYESHLDLPERRKGKVREVYRVPGEAKIAIVASDRISAFDVIMPTAIPGKGALLTEVATFWLRFIADRGLCGTHLLSTDAADLPEGCGGEAVAGHF